MEVNHEQLKKLIKTSYNKKMPLMIHGKIGIGKSSLVRQVAQEIAQQQKIQYSEGNDYENEKQFHLIDRRASQMDAVDIMGIPNFDKENKTTIWYIPDWLPKKGKGIIFADELNLAPPSVQSSFYSLILDRKVGSYELPDGFVVIAAGNLATDKSHSFEMAAPLNNRFIHCELMTPSIEQWTSWAMENKIDPRVLTFLNYKISYLHKFSENQIGHAFPTPRTWSYVSNLIKGVKDLKELKLLSATAVGDGVATEFKSFIKLQDKFDIEKILKDPDSFVPPKDLSLKYALISCLAEQLEKDLKHFEPILKVSLKLETEFAILLLYFSKKIVGLDKIKEMVLDPRNNENLAKLWSKWTVKYSKFLED